MSITVSTRALGRSRPLLSDFDVLPPEGLRDDGNLLLRDLITHVVREQVAAYESRKEAERFDRVLSVRQINEGAAKGKIDPAGKELPREIDVEEAIATALLAFEDGLYLVILDQIERRNLDEQVYLSPQSRVVFLRLTFLAGA